MRATLVFQHQKPLSVAGRIRVIARELEQRFRLAWTALACKSMLTALESAQSDRGIDPGGVLRAGRTDRMFDSTEGPELKIRDVIKLVESDGWRMVKQIGSHRHYKHSTKPGKVTIAGHPSMELARRPSRASWTKLG
jgi:predicted RNA binding protein YcfA (HicA-like mRNA interferase family)